MPSEKIVDSSLNLQYREILKTYYDHIEGDYLSNLKSHNFYMATINEVIDNYENRPKIRKGYWWGQWLYTDNNYLELYIEGFTNYIFKIDIRGIKTIEDMVWKYSSIISKHWITPEIAGGLIMALNDIFMDDIIKVFLEKEDNKGR